VRMSREARCRERLLHMDVRMSREAGCRERFSFYLREKEIKNAALVRHPAQAGMTSSFRNGIAGGAMCVSADALRC